MSFYFTGFCSENTIKKNISHISENNYNYTIFYIVIFSCVKTYDVYENKSRVMCFCKVISNIYMTRLWVTLLPEAKFQSLCLFKHKNKEKSKEKCYNYETCSESYEGERCTFRNKQLWMQAIKR